MANTYITFQGKVYKMDEDAKEGIKPSTRAYIEYFHGIMTEKQTAYGSDETKVLVRVGRTRLSSLRW